MTIRLRPHHLLCMLTFVGRGYSPAFVENYKEIARRLSAGEDIKVVEGPDDICAPLLDDHDPHCHGEGVALRDRQAAEALAGLIGNEIAPELVIVPNEALLDRLRLAFKVGDVRTACGGCQWSSLCTRVAEHGFPGILVGSAPIVGEVSEPRKAETGRRKRARRPA